jgi:hypothetical protein
LKTVKINHPKGQRPEIKLTVRRVEASVWTSMLFDKSHYLTSELNKSCKCLLFEWNNVPVAFVGILNTPRKGIPYGCSISRIVILPDYQGLGLSTIIFNFVGGIVKSLSDDEHDYRLYIKTAHSKFGQALSRNPNVRGTVFDGKGRDKKSADNQRYRNRLTRVSYCKEYIGGKIDGFQDMLKPIGELRKSKMLK